MHTRTPAAALLLAAGLLLTACSTGNTHHPGPHHPASTPTASPTFSTEADYIHACTQALIDNPDEPMPDACTALRSDDFNTALMAAQRSKKTGGTRDDSCKAAIKAQYEPGTAILTGPPSRPRECAGVSDDELSAIVTEVIEENTSG